MKQQGKLTSDDYEMVDYMLNVFKMTVGIGDKNDKKRKNKKNGEGSEKTEIMEGPDYNKCVGYDFNF